MRQFIKFVTASCLGTILALAVIFLFFVAVGMGSSQRVQIAKNSILELKLDQLVPELTDNTVPVQFTFEDQRFIGLNDINKMVKRAADDDNIRGILLRTESSNLHPSKAYAIADMIKEFSESGKFVYAYGNFFSQSGYLIASTADSVFLNPNGLIDLRGYGYILPYFKDFSDKTDISFDVYYAGQFKSAIEPYTRTESSEANRYQTQEFLTDYEAMAIEHIQNYRGLSRGAVTEIIDGALCDNADDAISLGLVDGLEYWEEFENRMKDKLDVRRLKLVQLDKYYSSWQKKTSKADDRIAVVFAEGDILFNGDSRGVITMERYEKVLDRVRDNKKIKAVVLRVNSPGGSAFTSDVFWKKVEELKASGKYVVASFGSYAASGGYYIACGADTIVSEPATLTGSIGVFSLIPDMSSFFRDKMGINWDTIGTGNHTFMYSTMVSRSPGDHAKILRETERIYDQFKQRVADGRSMTPDEVEQRAQGRVWSGRDAIEVGLVDVLGDLDDAIQIAAKKTGLEEYKLLEYPVIKKSFYEQLISDLMSGAETRLFPYSGNNSKLSRTVVELLDQIERSVAHPQARLPFAQLEH